MDVDVATGRVDRTVAVESGFQSTQPEDAAENPVAVGMAGRQVFIVVFPGWATPDKHRAPATTGSNFCPDDQPATRGAAAAIAFTRAVPGGRDRVLLQQAVACHDIHALAGQADPE